MELNQGYPPQQNTTMPFFTRRDEPSTTKWLESNDDLIDEIDRYLRGVKIDRSQMPRKEVQVTKPIMNSKGCFYIVNELRKITGRQTYLGNLNEQEISKACIDTCETINQTLRMSYDDFDLDLKHFSSVMNMVRNAVDLAFKRALLGHEKEFLQKTTQEHVYTQRNNESNSGREDSQGVWGWLRRR